MGSGWGGSGAERVAEARAREAAKGDRVHVHPALPPLPLSTSQMITARSIERSTGRSLADAARRYIDNGTTANRELLEQALTNYEKSIV